MKMILFQLVVDKSEKAVGSSDPEDNEEGEDKPQPSVAEQEVNIEYFKQKDYYRIINFILIFPKKCNVLSMISFAK